MRALMLAVIVNVVCFSFVACGMKIKLRDVPLMATFWPEDNYEGFPFEVRGFHNVCYNFHGRLASVTLGEGTIPCELHETSNCDEEGPPYRELWNLIPTLNWGWGVPAEIKSIECYSESSGRAQPVKLELLTKWTSASGNVANGWAGIWQGARSRGGVMVVFEDGESREKRRD